MGENTCRRFVDFFTANIPNNNTRIAYARAVKQFFAWCEKQGLALEDIQPYMIAAYIEKNPASIPTIKQHLAAIRTLFDWLVTGQIVPFNPASSVKAPKLVVKTGKTHILSDGDVKKLFEHLSGRIKASKGKTFRPFVLRDRALIATMFYTFGRISAVINLKVKDYVSMGKRKGLRLHEKGGNYLEIPVHHKLEEYLEEYLDAVGFCRKKKSYLYQAADQRKIFTGNPLDRSYVFRMIRKRGEKAGISPERICCHSFRATGITNYLSHGGKLEHAQNIAGHASAKTTKLYDRRSQKIAQDEIERILI